MNVTDKAEMVATWAHRNQTDKGGVPYIEHCRRVATAVRAWCVANNVPHWRTENAVAVAWLHDVIEDTDWAIVDLVHLRFDNQVVGGVMSMTQGSWYDSGGRKQYEELETYWTRVKNNWYAHVVKVKGDIPDNDDPVRFALLNDPKFQAKLHSKYQRARAFLGQPTIPFPYGTDMKEVA